MLYKDKNAKIEDRVEDLLSRMNLEEKIAQLKSILPTMILDIQSQQVDIEKLKHFGRYGLGRIPQFAMPFIDGAKSVALAYNTIQKFFVEETRLGIPILTQVECLNGLVAADATSFPTPILLASSWKPELVEEAVSIINEQMVALGLRFGLAPVVDLARDPRWGRVYETYGEDKYLTSAIGIAYSKGLQKENLKESAISCAKHFLGYATTEGGLNMAQVVSAPRELYDHFATPFEAMIKENNIQGIMSTYSAIDERPVSISKPILTDLLRDKMGFTGTAVSDGGSIELAFNLQRAVPSMMDAAIEALKAGLDADAPITEAYNHLQEAVENGSLDISYIDKACRRVLYQKFALGLFDQPYANIENVDKVFNNPEADKLSKKLCDEGIILLKNNGILPLDNVKTKKLAVIGPHGDSLRLLFAGYSYPATIEMMMNMMQGFDVTMAGVTDKSATNADIDGVFVDSLRSKTLNAFDMETYIRTKYHSLTIKEALKNKEKHEVVYAKGCDVSSVDRSNFDQAIVIAKDADVVIMTLGEKCGWSSDCTCGEGKDRASLDLPGVQEELLKTIHSLGKKIVLVLFNGRPMTISWAQEHVDAILDVWFPGPQGAVSIADILYGDVNPSGKLPITFPRKIGQIPMYYNHPTGSGFQRIKSPDGLLGSMEEIFGGGYTDMAENAPLYPFGHGLSYTTFDYHNLVLSNKCVSIDDTLDISIDITNTGSFSGQETVQVYIRDEEAYVTRPIKELVGFHKLTLEPNESKRVLFSIPMTLLGFTNHNNQFVVEPGKMSLFVGSSSLDIRLSDSFEIVGETKIVQKQRTFLSKSSSFSL